MKSLAIIAVREVQRKGIEGRSLAEKVFTYIARECLSNPTNALCKAIKGLSVPDEHGVEAQISEAVKEWGVYVEAKEDEDGIDIVASEFLKYLPDSIYEDIKAKFQQKHLWEITNLLEYFTDYLKSEMERYAAEREFVLDDLLTELNAMEDEVRQVLK